MKSIISIILALLFVSCSFFGCNNFLGDSSQMALVLGVKQTLDNNAPFTILNEPEYNRFSVTYSASKDTRGKPAFFSFEIRSDSDENENWSSYNSPNDNSVFSFKDENGEYITFENGVYEFYGEKTVYIYYDSAPEKMREFCKNFPPDVGGVLPYSIDINGYYLDG